VGRIKALLLLGLALIRTLLKILFGLNRRGVDAFTSNYAADGLPRVSPEERERIATFGGCIACGICDRGESERIAASQGAYPGIMSLMLAGSRSMPDYGATAIGLSYVDDETLSKKEQLCPGRVPMRQIARFIRSKASQAKVSVPAG
jgi:hypothetical protein